MTVNERLIGDLRFQEEKYTKAFCASPDGLALIDARVSRPSGPGTTVVIVL